MLPTFWGLVAIACGLAGLIGWCLARLETLRQERERRAKEPVCYPKVWRNGRYISIAPSTRR